jgi:hypothetical protein
MLTPEQQTKLAAGFPRETVELPEVGGSIIVRKLDARRDDDLIAVQYTLKPSDKVNPKTGKPDQVAVPNRSGFSFRQAAACECDADGRYLYPLGDGDHAAFDAAVEAMGTWPPRIFARVMEAVRRVNPSDSDGPEQAAGN